MSTLNFSPNEQIICSFACGILLVIIIQLICKLMGVNEYFDSRTDYGGSKYFSYDSSKAAWASLLSDSAAPDNHKEGAGSCNPDRFDPFSSYDISNKQSPGNPGARINPGWGMQYGPGPYDPQTKTYHNYSHDADFTGVLWGDVSM